MVKKLGQFCKRGGFCLLVELYWEGSDHGKIGTRLFSELFVVSTVGQKPNTTNTQTTAQLLRPKETPF